MKQRKIYQTMKKLQLEFYKIQCMNWIPNKSNGTGSAGRTLEILLNKPADKNILPDYHGIELKTQVEGSKYPLRLFSMAFDNKPMEMRRLLKICGYPDKKKPNFKVFQITVGGKTNTYVGFSRSYKLVVDYAHKVVRLYIFDSKQMVIDNTMSWSFSQLQSRLEHKLLYMAHIKVKKWNLHDKVYFKFETIQFYHLRDFDIFLYLIETGTISVTFKLGYYKSGDHYGEIYDHGTTFEIRSSNIDDLFERIDL